MKMDAFAFGTTNWAEVEKTEHAGETGIAYWRTRFFGEKPDQIRVRMVEYTPGYLADHWCQKGHIVHCLEGEFVSELETGQRDVISKGMMYVVSDGASSHRSISENGVKLLIIDGDFLKMNKITPKQAI